MVNEFQTGVRRQTEGFQTKTDADLSRIRRSDIGYTLGQLYPALNTYDAIPRVLFGLNVTGTDPVDFTYDNRLGNTAQDYLYSVRDNVTWTRGQPHVQGRRLSRVHAEQRGARRQLDGRVSSSRGTPTTRSTPDFAYSNALLGVFQQYTETDRFRTTHNRAWMSEFYVQDTWRTTCAADARLRRALPLLRALREGRTIRSRTSIRRRFDPAKAPRLYLPAIVNGARVAFDPVTGQVQTNANFIGAYVPGTGDPNNGMVEAGNGVPRGFRKTLAPQIEPRLGATWDLTGAGTTVLHASAGLLPQRAARRRQSSAT